VYSGFSTPEEYGKEWFQKSPHYYPPFRLQDRLRFLLTPLLRTYKRRSVDLVTFASSFVDAAQLAKEQATQDGHSTALGKDLITRYAERLGETLVELLESDYLEHATLLWRTAHVPKGISGIPANVVLTLDEVAQTVVEDLQSGTQRGWWTNFAHALEPAQQAKLRVDYSGRMLQGQTTHLGAFLQGVQR
jgi:hypothetical protein